MYRKGILALVVVGVLTACTPPPVAVQNDFAARSGETVMVLAHVESTLRGFDAAGGIDGTRAIGTTTLVFEGGVLDSENQLTQLRFRKTQNFIDNPSRATYRYIVTPGPAQTFMTGGFGELEAGGRYTAAAFNPLPDESWKRGPQMIPVSVNILPGSTDAVEFEIDGQKIVILQGDVGIIKYRLVQLPVKETPQFPPSAGKAARSSTEQ